MDFLSREKPLFKNPNKKPLNELQLEIQIIRKVKKVGLDKDLDALKDSLSKNYDVRTQKIPALDDYWVQKHHSYHEYQPYYSEVSQDDNDLFLSKNKQFLDNLTFLLRCNYHQFWNYMIFEPRIKKILRGFLISAVNWYEIKHLDGEFLKLYEEIYEKIARVYLRLFTFRESDVEFMSRETVEKLIEEHELISYPLIVNICLLYGKTCQKLVNDVCELFFTPRRREKCRIELKKIFDHALLVFEMVGGQICGFEANSVVIPIGIRPKPARFDPYWFEEVVTYLLDTAATLNAFLTNCHYAVDLALEMGIPYRLTYFYNNVYPAVYESLNNRSQLPFEWPKIKERILDHIGIGRSEFVNTFHVFVSYLVDNVIQSLGNNEKQDYYLEQYLKLVTAALEDEFFIFDYQSLHKIDVQLQMISDFHPQMDHMRTDYILECLSTLPTMEKVLSVKNVIKKPKADLFTFPTPGPSEIAPVQKEYGDSEIHEMVKAVLDTLPHLGDGFVRECLKVYNFNPSEVIAAVLDENLPPHLEEFDRGLIYVPPEPEPEQPILAYRGKKPTYKDTMDLLNDKSDCKEVKDFVLKTSNLTYDVYDDEYDDRYDNEPVRFYERTEDDNPNKPVEKRFEGYELVSDPSDSSDEETPVRTKTKDFCEDPAVLRARREAQFGAQRSNRGDVVGKPKGQGQDKNVVQSRDKKNVNKSSRGNHSRKSGAQWKRNKGMIPM